MHHAVHRCSASHAIRVRRSAHALHQPPHRSTGTSRTDTCESSSTPIDDLIAVISPFAELLPGDVILIGSPHANGQPFAPPRWLQHGDEIGIEADGLGALDTRVVIESKSSEPPRSRMQQAPGSAEDPGAC